MSTHSELTETSQESSTTYSLVFGIAAYAFAALLILIALSAGGWSERLTETGGVAALTMVLQVLVALAVYQVWLLRPARRGKGALGLREEFAVFGLPAWSVIAVGAAKLMLATLLIVGMLLPAVVLPSAVAMSLLMLGAVVMHLKVRDPIRRTAPAVAVFAMSVAIVFLSI